MILAVADSSSKPSALLMSSFEPMAKENALQIHLAIYLNNSPQLLMGI